MSPWVGCLKYLTSFSSPFLVVERLFNGATAGSEDDDDVGQQRACLCTGGLQQGSFSAVVNYDI